MQKATFARGLHLPRPDPIFDAMKYATAPVDTEQERRIRQLELTLITVGADMLAIQARFEGTRLPQDERSQTHPPLSERTAG